ncbi:ATP-dependent zinc metalloprotease FtsH [Candidatus Walczuchella endosymbiont of Icerya purchasi]|uniref:ATP-dependent zinc metalloprotease FtsH n=1 Tax=Candidatus Walczuchella endosymbiont of Icerya purchasi TaxID=3066219 RepID=UPI00313D64B3
MNKNKYFFFLSGFLIILGIFLFQYLVFKRQQISPDFFFKILSEKRVQKIIITNHSKAIIWVYKKNIKNKKYLLYTDFDHYELTINNFPFFSKKIEEYKYLYKLNLILLLNNQKESNFSKTVIESVFFFFLFVIFWGFILSRINVGSGKHIFNIGKSKAKLFDENDNVKITFQDVAGLEGAKEEIQEIVDFLKNPNKYTNLGGKIPKGALLVGPPGTGKTLLAKAVAGEAQVPFFSLSGSDFVEMFVGVGASRVRDLFKQAKEKSPSIIFIDEIDAIGRSRVKNNINGANDERENTLNQLLTEMDGFDTNTNVIVMSATNRSEILDQALLRPGRFDRTLFIDLPELNERKEIFLVHIKKLKIAKDIDIEFLSRQTSGFSGADIANICNESAIIAARQEKSKIEYQDFLSAIDRIIGGFEKKNKVIKLAEKERIAYHEAGHAAISWLIEHAAPLVKVTIVPRGKSLGAAWYLPEERQLTTFEQMQDEICALLGGRAAEQVIFKTISTGALNDLERVTKQAQSMVTIFGLNKRIGNISYYDSTVKNESAKPYSENTARIIDEEISKIIEEQYQRAYKLLANNRVKLKKLAKKLLDKEVIFKEDLEEIFGNRPFP